MQKETLKKVVCILISLSLFVLLFFSGEIARILVEQAQIGWEIHEGGATLVEPELRLLMIQDYSLSIKLGCSILIALILKKYITKGS